MFAVELVLLENVARSGKGGGQAKDGEYLGKFIFFRNCKFLSFVRGFNGVFLFLWFIVQLLSQERKIIIDIFA